MGRFCLYSDRPEFAPCFSINTFKCHNLDDLLNGIFHGSKRVSVPAKIECLNLSTTMKKFDVATSRCINCMFCVFGCTGHRALISCDMGLNDLCYDINKNQFLSLKREVSSRLFNKKIFYPRAVKFSSIKVKYKDFDDFTSVDETENIAVWTANAMKYLSKSQEPAVSLEVHVDKRGSRDGRLDVSLYNKNDGYLLVAETKTTFEDMMNDKRFKTQLNEYNIELDKKCAPSIKHKTFLVVGGEESDLLPPVNPMCTSNVGNQSALFYKILKDNGIFFLSANSLLALGLSKLYLSVEKFNLENVFDKIVSSNKYYGLLSCGAIDKDFQIVDIKNVL